MEKINPAPTETIADNTGENFEPIEKPECTKKIESFDLNNLSPENFEFMFNVIQDAFRRNLPVDNELIDKIPDRTKILSTEEFIRIRQEEGGGEESELGYESETREQIFINLPKHLNMGTLFSTMFHEGLHYASNTAGAGLNGGFGLPEDEKYWTDEYFNKLTEGIRVIVEGTTQTITEEHVLNYLKFDPQDQMYGYDPECLVMGTIWGYFSKKERNLAYFKTPIELLRVNFEDTLEKEYNTDKPTGVFADCLVKIGETTKKLRDALKTWNEDNNAEPVENILDEVRRATEFYINQKSKNDEEDKKKLHGHMGHIAIS